MWYFEIYVDKYASKQLHVKPNILFIDFIFW